MRHQVNNCPRNFPLLQICLHSRQKLLQATDTARESSRKPHCSRALTRQQVSEPALSNYNELFPKTEAVFSPRTQLHLVRTLIPTNSCGSNHEKYCLVRLSKLPPALFPTIAVFLV